MPVARRSDPEATRSARAWPARSLRASRRLDWRGIGRAATRLPSE